MNKKVIEIVRKYVEEHLDKSDPKQEFEVFVVQQCYNYKPKRQLMATDVIRELKKLIEENGDKPVFVSTGFECADACSVSTYDNGDIYIGQ